MLLMFQNCRHADAAEDVAINSFKNNRSKASFVAGLLFNAASFSIANRG
jgi:hypothetical protein